MSETHTTKPQAKIMLITGGSRGIGAATAYKAADQGFDVAISYTSSRETAEEIARNIRAKGKNALAVPCDVRDEDSIKNFFDKTEQELGPITAVFANAGITGPVALLKDLRTEDLKDVMDTNVMGAFITVREGMKRMSSHGGGTIVVMSSRAAQLGSGGEFIHYAASKGAMDSLTIGLAREAASDNIRVNAVAPGLIDTQIHNVGDGKRLERLLPGVPMGRVGGPDEVADVVLWLSGPQSSYVNGAIIPISGGR